MSPRDPTNYYAVIDYLQPFIDGKVSHSCDLERQEKLHHSSVGITPNRHRGHTWCHDNPFTCECPCHWTPDERALKLIELHAQYTLPEDVGKWLDEYVAEQRAEAERLRSLAHGRDTMIERVQQALA